MVNNLNILADLEAKEQEFISVRELFERIRLLQPHVTDIEIAKWLAWLIKNKQQPEFVWRNKRGDIETTNWNEDPDFDRLIDIVLEEGIVPIVKRAPTNVVTNIALDVPMDFDDDIPF
ncbi:hypothetical protein SerAS12_4095 [Serratia sp. AS12]|uniref:hypothetical protein n=1 Tax=Serratia TaxID=613 RepID=UPI00020E9C2C|nr:MULTISPECIES: hypothetical protein [Serratia]AEF47193.1 hypothetical protein SerAS9_4094 [Serratia plymuthica AS9]AEF52145.1 hypothetical protein SerAS12_4095 [Serratia sp. AS12]AEG29852.1 hypothetical protein SerAS13_4095 [Serratia sp. AS13]UTN95878.1 hypothetical protein NLX81_20830 [Serratia plymuthica]